MIDKNKIIRNGESDLINDIFDKLSKFFQLVHESESFDFIPSNYIYSVTNINDENMKQINISIATINKEYLE